MATECAQYDLTTPVVCIGLSAGGIAPLQEVFRALRPNTDMAFVVIHHLRRERPTALVSILSGCTQMPVQLVVDGLSILPNHVYVLPSGDEIALTDGSFHMRPRSKLHGWPNLLSIFLESMTRSGHPGIAVILSGMDSDGAQAMMKLKQHGGIIIAQAPITASSPDMPLAAIDTGAVDYVLEPHFIGVAISRLATDMKRRSPDKQSAVSAIEWR